MVLRRLIHFGPLIALFVIFTCYAVSVIDSYLWLAPPRHSLAGGWNLLVLTVWLALILHNFFWAVFLGPGFVPEGWKPEEQKDEEFLQFCQVCRAFKPPRAHHCRTCKRCVMKMDHHCPWINTCCGYKNHTNFVLFLFFAPVGCIHALTVCIITLLYQLLWRNELYRYGGPYVSFSVNAFFANVFACGLAFGTIVAVGVLFYQQMKSIITNKTGIEQWIAEKAEDRFKEKKLQTKFVYPYDLGKMNNLKQVINWTCTPIGDGFSWPVVEGCTTFTLSIEQLEQKKEKKKRIVICKATELYSGWWFPFTKGCRTCICVPCSDEPRIPLLVGDILEASRGTKYWLYGNKVLTEREQKEGKRVRGWVPRRCVTRLGRKFEDDNNKNSIEKKMK